MKSIFIFVCVFMIAGFAFYVFADDSMEISQSKDIVSSVVSSDSFLRDSLQITVMEVVNGKEHPQWVHLDFPWSSSTGRTLGLIKGAIGFLFENGCEPSFLSGQAIVGRITLHRDKATLLLRQAQEKIVPGDTIAIVDSLRAIQWRVILQEKVSSVRF